MTPEIQAIPAPVMDAWLAAPALRPYRFHLEKILRDRPHTRTAAEEDLLAMSREMAAAAAQAFGQLDNADLRFGRLADESGREVELSHGNFMRFMLSRDRDLRREAFHRYYRAYDDHRNTLAALLAASVRRDVFYARARAFPNCRAHALFADNIPEAVYDRLVATVRAGLKPVFDYFEFRRKALGLSELHVYDTYVPLAEQAEVRMTYAQAVEVCTEALAPLGEGYTAEMRAGLLGGWVDRFENRGKRSGAYASGCYDSPPYILLNYDERTINSVYTLAHEAGHAMHSLYARRHQPYVDHDYTIFVAEVASTFNEALLTRHLLRMHSGDARMRRYLITREIDAIRATLVRQTMFAEFEHRVHRLAEDNRPLTLETLTGVYREIARGVFRRRRAARRRPRARVPAHPALLFGVLRLPVRDRHLGRARAGREGRGRRARRPRPLPRVPQAGRQPLPARRAGRGRGRHAHPGARGAGPGAPGTAGGGAEGDGVKKGSGFRGNKKGKGTDSMVPGSAGNRSDYGPGNLKIPFLTRHLQSICSAGEKRPDCNSS